MKKKNFFSKNNKSYFLRKNKRVKRDEKKKAYTYTLHKITYFLNIFSNEIMLS